MKKMFRWSCIILSLVAFCAWALLLHEAMQPWKLIGVNETSNSFPSTSSLVLMPTSGLSVTSTVSKTTETLIERITSPVETTVNDLTSGITSAPRTSLQSLVYTTQSTIPNSSTIGTIVGNTTTTALQSPVRTLTSQTLGTVSSVTSTVSSVTSSAATSG